MKIKALVHTVSSKSDTFGNRYHFCTVTRTKDGKSVSFEAGGERNGEGKAMKAVGDWGNIVCTNEEVGYREWSRLAKGSARECKVDLNTFLK